MKCPNCGCTLEPWYWQEGDAKGVQCPGCRKKWWSDQIADKISIATKSAVDALVLAESFPADAVEDKEGT